MGAYTAGGTGSGDTHIPKMISGGRKQPVKKAAPAKIVKKAAPKKQGK